MTFRARIDGIRSLAFWALTGCALLGVCLFTTPALARPVSVDFGTMAPKASPWGRVFSMWSRAAKKESGGALKLTWYFGGQQGDEKAMVAKIRAGQLDGGAMTAVGLGAIHNPILAMQMPGLFSSRRRMDKVIAKLLPSFEKGMAAEGFLLLGARAGGKARTMSKREIRTPEDLKRMKVFRWSDDPVGAVIASELGYTAVPLTIGGVLPALRSKRIDTLTVPCLAASLMQWRPHLNYLVTQPVAIGMGGLVMSKSKADGMPEDAKAVLRRTGKKAGKLLAKTVRKEQRKAYRKVRASMTPVKLTKGELKQWSKAFKRVRKRLGEGTFPAALVKKLEQLAGR